MCIYSELPSVFPPSSELVPSILLIAMHFDSIEALLFPALLCWPHPSSGLLHYRYLVHSICLAHTPLFPLVFKPRWLGELVSLGPGVLTVETLSPSSSHAEGVTLGKVHEVWPGAQASSRHPLTSLRGQCLGARPML